MRKTILATDHIYHIYNRGVEKRNIFLDGGYYIRFIETLAHSLNYDYPYSRLKHRLKQARSPQNKQLIAMQLEEKRIEPPVEVISFCLMPNHYHLTLKQLIENGITDFLHRIGTAFTKYFNIRQDRTGRLFEGTFKAISVDSDEQLLHLTRYQHINPRKLGLDTLGELINYPWSSLSTYLGEKHFPFVKPEVVLSNFKSLKDYLDFASAEVDEFEPLRLNEVAIDDDFGWFAHFRALEKEQKEQIRELYIEYNSQKHCNHNSMQS